ncbi:sarcosine oxidase subunit gamma [Mesorhizobium sp. M0482]|uniref:sarcosine oxidase subunit gamma n=1 Tax=Mesorhizobium sp. M0482 TaxID=2956948 RepID=UPI00333A2F67
MSDLKPATALGYETPRSLAVGTLSLEENTGLALASLALRRGTIQPAPFGLTLPGTGAWASNDQISAFWTGPDQWMIEASGRAETVFASELSALCPSCSITEQTDGFVAFEIRSATGEVKIAALMAKLVNLDPASFAAGSASRTGLEHMSVFVIRRAPDHLAILGMRSAAATLWHILETSISRIAEVSE